MTGDGVGTALHAEAGSDAAEVRWVAPEATLPAAGTVLRAPGDLGSLLDEGVLVDVVVLPGHVVTRVPDASDWPRVGARVRRAVAGALTSPTAWVTHDDGPSARDDALAAAARELLAGTAGDYVRSHGGVVEILGARDGVVTVHLRGTCQGCPASQLTLRDHLEQRLREVRPDLVAVVEA